MSVSSPLQAVDASFVKLEGALRNFSQTLQEFPFPDAEEKRDAVLAYQNTSKNSLKSFSESLSQQTGIQQDGILRLVHLFDLLASRILPFKDKIPLLLFGVLKATLITGYHLCNDLSIVTTKLDRLSERTTKIDTFELGIVSEDIAQSLLAQLSACVVDSCGRILLLRSRADVQAYEPSVYDVDHVCLSLEREADKARRAAQERERVEALESTAKERQIQDVQAWIEDMLKGSAQDKHDLVASNRVDGTGAAFICEIQQWLETKNAPIFLAYGSPGVGKTYLACAVISHHFERPFQGIDGMAYIYFTYDDRDRQTPFFLYASLVSQLLRNTTQMRKDIIRLFEEQKKLAHKQRSQILKAFKHAVNNMGSSKLLIFDALDEASEDTRDAVLDLLEGAHSGSSRLFVTSRSDYRDSLPHEQVLNYHVQADAGDIRAFSNDRLKNRQLKRIMKAKFGNDAEAHQFASSIVEEILNNSQGLFLHAYYAVKDVCEQVSVSGIKKAASKQHKDANVIYAITLEQIMTLATAKKDLAHRTIAWLTFAKKPLEENELKEAFTIDNQTGRADLAAQLDVENVVDYCRGLVVRVKSRGMSYLRLAHMTAQEYFSQDEMFQRYHADMCLTCFNRVMSCLAPFRKKAQRKSSVTDRDSGNHEKFHYLDELVEEPLSDSYVDETASESDSSSTDGGYDGEPSEAQEDDDAEDEITSLFEDSHSQTTSENNQSWRYVESVWPKTLLPWVAKKTHFSSYAGTYALSHLKEATLTDDLEKAILTFVWTANSRRRWSTFSSKLQDHPYRMKMLHMCSFIGIPSVVEEVANMPTIGIDDRDILGRTALMWALGLGNEAAARMLLQRGAQVHSYDHRHRSTISYASMIKDEKLLVKLLETVPSVDLNASFLCSCAKANNVFLLNGALSRAESEINNFNEFGRTPLHEAIIGNSENAVRLLIEHGAHISASDRVGRTPLMDAALGQNSGIIDLLVKNGASAEAQSEKNDSPLHIAAKSAKTSQKRLQILLRAGANPLSQGEKGLVPLQVLIRTSQYHSWAEKEVLACVKLLSRDPSTISHQSEDGSNALHDAVQSTYVSVLKDLVNRAPPNAVNARKHHGQTPIFEALIAYNVAAFDFLVGLPGIDLLATRDDKKNLLNCAAWANKIAVAQKLIDSEPRLITLAEEHSVSAIHYSVERDNPAMFELLLNAGSDPRSRRHRLNVDLISYAAFEGRAWCLDTLLRLKAWINYDHTGQSVAHKDDLGKTLLHAAASSGSPPVLRTVLNALPLDGLSLEDRDGMGLTPLHHATRARNETLVSLLLHAGSHPDNLTTHGDSALDLALVNGAIDIISTLISADAHVSQGSRLKLPEIRRYENKDFYPRLKKMLDDLNHLREGENSIDTEIYQEKTARRTSNQEWVYSEDCADTPFLEISIPGNAVVPIRRVVFKTISHDQGYSWEAGQWGGTYEHSHSYFEAAVQSTQANTGDTGQGHSPRLRVQTNIHADPEPKTHVNVLDCDEGNQGRSDWVKSLQPGDRIQLYAVAMYPGWRNYVQEAEITINYHEVIGKEGQNEERREDFLRDFQGFTLLEQNRVRNSQTKPSVIVYHQSLHADNGIMISLRPLVRENTSVAAVILGNFSLYLNDKEPSLSTPGTESNGGASICLNDYALDDSSIDDLWTDTEYLQKAGIKIIGLLSLRADDTSDNKNILKGENDSVFQNCYKLLHGLVISRRLDGLNLDVDIPENFVSADGGIIAHKGAIQLIDRLHADFGADFVLSITTSVQALLNDNGNMASERFDIRELELQRGHLINWYIIPIFGPTNEQATDNRDPSPLYVRQLNSYIRLLSQKLIMSRKILVSISTNPDVSHEIAKTRGAYLDLRILQNILDLLYYSYSPLDFGGIAGWEYYRAGDPRQKSPPWVWMKKLTEMLTSVFAEPGCDSTIGEL